MRAWHLGLCAALLCGAVACGGKKKAPDMGGLSTGGTPDGGTRKKTVKPDAGVTGTAGSGATGGGAKKDAQVPRDAGPEPYDAFGYDAAGDYRDAMYIGEDAGPVPAGWTCPPALWNDSHCDCGCSAIDVDCEARGTSCSDPGCVAAICEACFTLSGSWKPCVPDPLPSDWTCDPAAKGDSLCDCGCGSEDTTCQGQGCSTPGCRTPKCDARHGCSSDQIAHDDDCSSSNPRVLTNGTWHCPWDRYAAGDGCDCGCGAPDPDCAAGGGCSAGRCYQAACDRCNDAEGRSYSCDAAHAGWDEDIVGDATTSEPSECQSKHFGAGDGCDCGCGGHDPDCGSGGCDQPGCELNHPEFMCDRCTDINSRKPTGCDVPATWTDGTHACKPEHFGTGDGCDCGCGATDPDCKGNGCTTPGCTDAACDVCNDGTGFYVQCQSWTCTDSDAFGTTACDCGCGVIDPACRDLGKVSCTSAGCETAACDYCNDKGGVRSACGGQWTSGNSGKSSQCSLSDYGLDGLCDCGCGGHDPDCKSGTDCTDKGCVAAGCDVCHDGSLLDVCYAWTCGAAAFGSGDGCDCGCGAADPDCGGEGCRQPGCMDAKCTTCHDPLGRPVKCP